MRNTVKHGQYVIGYQFKSGNLNGFGSADYTVHKSGVTSYDEFKTSVIEFITDAIEVDIGVKEVSIVLLAVSRVAY